MNASKLLTLNYHLEFHNGGCFYPVGSQCPQDLTNKNKRHIVLKFPYWKGERTLVLRYRGGSFYDKKFW